MAYIALKHNQSFVLDGDIVTERPILFQTEMVQAILKGRKTQTRRKISPEIPDGKHTPWNHRDSKVWQWQSGRANVNYKEDERQCPYGKPGDLLWVRETFAQEEIWDSIESKLEYLYRADYNDPLVSYSPSIHMPKDAARIWLMIEDIRVERVQDISEADAIAEGIERISKNGLCSYKSYAVKYPAEVFPYVSFQTLWISINGDESWKANPWVWVIRYRILSKTGRPSLEVIEQAYSEIVNRKSEIKEEVPNG